VSLISLSQISRFFQKLDVKRICFFEFLAETRIKTKMVRIDNKISALPEKRMPDDKKTCCVISVDELLADLFSNRTDRSQRSTHRMTCGVWVFLRSLSYSFSEFYKQQ
jgi:hypothetical protein